MQQLTYINNFNCLDNNDVHVFFKNTLAVKQIGQDIDQSQYVFVELQVL